MKQKVVTKAIIRQDDKILLVRRRGGRPSISGMYELPGGRVHIGQQPEDALRHGLRIHLNVAPETVQLSDVLTFIDPDDRELQYLFIVFETSLEPSDKTIRLSSDHDKYIWKSLQEIQREELTKSTLQILGIQAVPFGTGHGPEVVDADDKKATLKQAIIYSDGGSRGNPGPSASGFVILDGHNQVIAEGGAFLGITTNNVAEYQAVYLGLERAQEMGITQVDFRMDSQLVANQMNGIYKIKHKDLIPINNRIRELAGQFEKVTFSHVMREYNKLADGVVNKILDQHTR
ncbi:MAG TPA: reverse transcriptase-like protein [Candidatus Saccharimonadales bacterium]|nr:reverse transcriptase-like protein [Candidatus Saccharimonadales bacterium]